MRSLIYERTTLSDTRLILSTTLFVFTLRCGDFLVSVGIVSLDSEVADVFDNINLESHVFGIT